MPQKNHLASRRAIFVNEMREEPLKNIHNVKVLDQYKGSSKNLSIGWSLLKGFFISLMPLIYRNDSLKCVFMEPKAALLWHRAKNPFWHLGLLSKKRSQL